MSSIEDALRRYYDGEMAVRAGRPLGEHRERCLAEFIAVCRREGVSSVVEVGCGAGRDAKEISAAGLTCTGLDASASSVAICTSLGLDVVQGSAVALPFGDDRFDAGWSMSTLMHLPGDGMATALSELERVIRPGGLLEVGVWGGDEDGEWTDEHGRYFRRRTDAGLLSMLGAVGEVTAFTTWGRLREGVGHYQWARVVVG